MREDGFMEKELQIQELREQLSNVQRRVDNQERVLREVVALNKEISSLLQEMVTAQRHHGDAVTMLAKLRAANHPANSSA